MGIWETFLEYLDADPETRIPKFSLVLQSLITTLFDRSLFSTNGSKLVQLDDVDKDEDGETEMQTFFRVCINLLSEIGDVAPQSIIELAVPRLEALKQPLFSLHEYSQSSLVSLSDSRRFVATVYDTKTILRIFGGLRPYLISNFESTFNLTEQIFKLNLDILQYVYQRQLLFMAPLFADLELEILSILHGFMSWLSAFESHSRSQPAVFDRFMELVFRTMEEVVKLIDVKIPESIQLVASSLLKSLFSTVRPLRIFGTQQLLVTMEKIQRIPEISLNVQVQLYTAVTGLFLLPSHNVPMNEQLWEPRELALSQFLAPFVQNIFELCNTINSQNSAEVANRLQGKFRILKNIIWDIQTEPKSVKVILEKSIHQTIPLFVNLFKMYSYQDNEEMMFTLLDFFYAVLKTLKSQVDIEIISTCLGTIFTFLEGEQGSLLLNPRTRRHPEILCRFLDILTFLVDDPTTSDLDKRYLNFILKLCLDLFPNLSQDDTRIRESLLSLCYKLLLNKSALISEISSSTDDISTKILQFFGSAFNLEEIENAIFILESLRNLEEKSNIFSKRSFFILRSNFLTLFLRTLLDKGSAIPQDEVISTIFAIISSAMNWDYFENEFLPAFVNEGVRDPQDRMSLLLKLKNVKDFPTFSTRIVEFMDDFAYFHTK
eukprot:TRINITY_DN1870_c1_g1_i2.p1 TRINITY_DN1870_c1_g1~~TRINITY_DN1870_c1_g1_i2.p1  ORF type:complete len:660 (-),score=229.07 TRINITY_DN1870_c1_g1_i2:11-1990(-)